MKNVNVSIRSDINMYNGEEVEVTYVIAEDSGGRVFSWNDSGISSNEMSSDSMYAKQEARVAKIEKFVSEGGILNLDNWTETYPAYGSEAYQGNAKEGYFTQIEN